MQTQTVAWHALILTKKQKTMQGYKKYNPDCACNKDKHCNVFVQLIIVCGKHETFKLKETFRSNSQNVFIK